MPRRQQVDRLSRTRRRITPGSQPVDGFVGVRVQEPQLTTPPDLRGLSRTLNAAAEAGVAENIREQEQLGREAFERNKENARSWAQAVAKGVVDETESPHFRKGFSTLAAKTFNRGFASEFELAAQEELRRRLQTDPETGLPVKPRSINDIGEEIYQRKLESVGAAGGATEFTSSIFARQLITEGKNEIFARVNEVAAKGADEVLRHHNRQMASVDFTQTFESTIADFWHPDTKTFSISPAAKVALQEKITNDLLLGNFANPSQLVIGSVETAVNEVSEQYGAEAAEHLLDALEDLKVGNAPLSKIPEANKTFDRMRHFLNLDAEREENKRFRERRAKAQDAAHEAQVEYGDAFIKAALKSPGAARDELKKALQKIADGPKYGDFSQEASESVQRMYSQLTQSLDDSRERREEYEEAQNNFENAAADQDIERMRAAFDALHPGQKRDASARIQQAREDESFVDRGLLEQGRSLIQRAFAAPKSAHSAVQNELLTQFENASSEFTARERELRQNVRALPEEQRSEAYSTGLGRIRQELLSEARTSRQEIAQGVLDFEKQFNANLRSLTDSTDLIREAEEQQLISPEEARSLQADNDRANSRAPYLRPNGPIDNAKRIINDLIPEAHPELFIVEGERTTVKDRSRVRKIRDQLEARMNEWAEEFFSTKAPGLSRSQRPIEFEKFVTMKRQELEDELLTDQTTEQEFEQSVVARDVRRVEALANESTTEESPLFPRNRNIDSVSYGSGSSRWRVVHPHETTAKIIREASAGRPTDHLIEVVHANARGMQNILRRRGVRPAAIRKARIDALILAGIHYTEIVEDQLAEVDWTITPIFRSPFEFQRFKNDTLGGNFEIAAKIFGTFGLTLNTDDLEGDQLFQSFLHAQDAATRRLRPARK